jgi:Hint domain
MAQSTGWNVHTINTSNNRTTGNTTPNTTINTDGTGAGPSLQAGETFQVGATTYTYGGTATAGTVGGFYAASGGNTFFFSKAVAANRPVAFGTADTPVCFFPGTLIRTPGGEVAVEALKAGDLVLTSEGEAKPVRWMGRQTVCTLFADPLRVLPVRIRAGALGGGLPVRDLLLSPDHALLVDGILIQAGALVDGATVTRERAVPEVFTYHHVELADHSLILAEGVPAETFIDNVARLAFDNWAEHEAAGTEAPIAEMALPRAKSARQVPMATRRRLAARAAAVSSAAMVAA